MLSHHNIYVTTNASIPSNFSNKALDQIRFYHLHSNPRPIHISRSYLVINCCLLYCYVMQRAVLLCLLFKKVDMSLFLRFVQGYSCSTCQDTHHYVYHGLSKDLQSLTSYLILNHMLPFLSHLQLIRQSRYQAFVH